MAKTQFVSGTKVLSTWLNSIFGAGAGGGHVHDGADSDGHAPKISLSSHVVNQLNLSTQATGILPIENIPIITGEFNATVSDTYFTTPVVYMLKYLVFGNIKMLYIPLIKGSHATNTNVGLTVTEWPAEINPGIGLRVPVIALSNNKDYPGEVVFPSYPGIRLLIMDPADGELKTDVFNVANKGMSGQTIIWTEF